MEDILTVRGLTRRFGALVVLDDISFSVPAGQVVVLLGPNGVGKTTLLRCVVGADRPDAGEVFLEGRLMDETDPWVRASVAAALDDMDFFPDLSVVEHLALLAFAHGGDRGAAGGRPSGCGRAHRPAGLGKRFEAYTPGSPAPATTGARPTTSSSCPSKNSSRSRRTSTGTLAGSPGGKEVVTVERTAHGLPLVQEARRLALILRFDLTVQSVPFRAPSLPQQESGR